MDRAIDDYLTTKTRATWTGALVYKEPDGSFTLERTDVPRIPLGPHIGVARKTLAQLRQATEDQS